MEIFFCFLFFFTNIIRTRTFFSMTGSRKQFANTAKASLKCAMKVPQNSRRIQPTKYAQTTPTLLLRYHIKGVESKIVLGSKTTKVRLNSEFQGSVANFQSAQIAKNLARFAPVPINQETSFLATVVFPPGANGSSQKALLYDRRDIVMMKAIINQHRILQRYVRNHVDFVLLRTL